MHLLLAYRTFEGEMLAYLSFISYGAYSLLIVKQNLLKNGN